MFSPTAILDITDVGAERTLIEQALLVAAAQAGMPLEQTAALPLGRRNALLLEARRGLFGDRMECRVNCPACGEALEFAVDCEQLLAAAVAGEETIDVQHGDLVLTVRAPNSADLIGIANLEEDTARQTLIGRCVLAAEYCGDTIDVGMLPEDVVVLVSERLRQHDPLAGIEYSLECPACRHIWEASLDCAAFVWREFVAQAERLLVEVHTLAQAYGWGEAEILALSERRRARYIALVVGTS